MASRKACRAVGRHERRQMRSLPVAGPSARRPRLRQKSEICSLVVVEPLYFAGSRPHETARRRTRRLLQLAGWLSGWQAARTVWAYTFLGSIVRDGRTTNQARMIDVRETGCALHPSPDMKQRPSGRTRVGRVPTWKISGDSCTSTALAFVCRELLCAERFVVRKRSRFRLPIFTISARAQCRMQPAPKTHKPFHSWARQLVCRFSASEMTYIVSSGALNSTHSLPLSAENTRSPCLRTASGRLSDRQTKEKQTPAIIRMLLPVTYRVAPKNGYTFCTP